MATPPEQRRLDVKPSVEILPPEISPAQFTENSKSRSCPETLVDYVSHTVLENLPNDLTRMIYLASLRDCNSGMYLHPELSQREGIQAADRALRHCHEQ